MIYRDGNSHWFGYIEHIDKLKRTCRLLTVYKAGDKDGIFLIFFFDYVFGY